MPTRTIREFDHPRIHSVVNEWWGRDVQGLAARFLFDHFRDTSFVVEDEGRLVAFLVGFVSQAKPDEAYIHLVGVRSDRRGEGIGRALYDSFFEEMRRRSVRTVSCVISPANTGSIHFHKSIGFEVVPGDTRHNGVAIQKDYAGQGRDRVKLVRDVCRETRELSERGPKSDKGARRDDDGRR